MSGCLAGIHANEEFTEVTVKSKLVDNSGTESFYLLITDKGVFEVDRPKYDSLNESRNPDIVFPSIEEGKSYTLHHYGYRIDFIYDYPIVVGAVEIKTA